MKLGAHMYVPLRMNSNSCGDPLTFHRAPSSGQIFNLSNTLGYDQISAKRMLFPPATALLCVQCKKL